MNPVANTALITMGILLAAFIAPPVLLIVLPLAYLSYRARRYKQGRLDAVEQAKIDQKNMRALMAACKSLP